MLAKVVKALRDLEVLKKIKATLARHGKSLNKTLIKVVSKQEPLKLDNGKQYANSS